MFFIKLPHCVQWCVCLSKAICLFVGLPLFWTSACKRGFSLADTVRLLCQRTAQLCRLDNQKGSLHPGHDADLVIWDPEKEFEVSHSTITEYDWNCDCYVPACACGSVHLWVDGCVGVCRCVCKTSLQIGFLQLRLEINIESSCRAPSRQHWY